MIESQTKTLGEQLRENVAHQRQVERLAQLELEARMLRDRISGFECALEEVKTTIRKVIQDGAYAPEIRFDEDSRMFQELASLETTRLPDGKVLLSSNEPTMAAWRAFRSWVGAEQLGFALRYKNHDAYEGEQAHEYVFQLLLPEDVEATATT